MDKIKIGFPKALYYYYDPIWKLFFHELGCEIVDSGNTNADIITKGLQYSNDEMCLSLKIFLGHVASLEGRCDYLFVPRIDHYGVENQTCTNFLALYDIVNNLFETPIFTCEIASKQEQNHQISLLKSAEQLGFLLSTCKGAYQRAMKRKNEQIERAIQVNYSKLSSSQLKILLVGHAYNLYDAYLGHPLVKYLKQLNCEVLYSDAFDTLRTNQLSKQLSYQLYWKHSKEAIGAIPLVENNIDGIVFLSSFPCGLDSLTNELVMRKIRLPYVNLVIDDMDSLTGMYTRLESFVDILEQKKQHES